MSNKALPVLLVDIGNTNLKWAIRTVDHPLSIFHATHRDQDLAAFFDSIWGNIEHPLKVLVSNVAGNLIREKLTQWVEDKWGLYPEFPVAEKEACGVINGYNQPSQLGIDRWLALIAARVNQRNSVCIVDAGTAITIDVMDSKGSHAGGLIIPGLGLMRDALLSGTKIPKVTEEARSDMFLGASTSSAVFSGSLHASAALIEKVVNHWYKTENESLTLILTGSDAIHLKSVLEMPCQIESDLVMRGLSVLAQ